MPKDDNYSGENYDQVVYYVAPAVLVAAILFCCFRMALVYYMQIRPRRNQSTVHTTSTREEVRAGTIPAACQEIFARVPPPPNYEQTLKNDRRCMSTIETSTRRDSNRRPTEIVINVEDVQQETPPNRSTTTRNTLRRAQSNVEASLSINAAPPAYSQRRVSIEALDSNLLSPQEARLRLPSYEEVTSEPEPESRHPTLCA